MFKLEVVHLFTGSWLQWRQADLAISPECCKQEATLPLLGKSSALTAPSQQTIINQTACLPMRMQRRLTGFSSKIRVCRSTMDVKKAAGMLPVRFMPEDNRIHGCDGTWHHNQMPHAGVCITVTAGRKLMSI